MPGAAEPAASNKKAGVEWTVSAAIAVTVIGIVGIQLPPRVKLLGLFAIVVGLFAGVMLRFLMQIWNLPPHRLRTAVATVLILTVQVGMGVGAWYRQAAILDEQNESHPILQQLEAEKLKLVQHDAEGEPDESEERQKTLQSIDEFERSLREDLERERSFGRYLQKRLSAVGVFDPPWPAVFWIAEVLAGTCAGVWTFRRTAKQDKGPAK